MKGLHAGKKLNEGIRGMYIYPRGSFWRIFLINELDSVYRVWRRNALCDYCLLRHVDLSIKNITDKNGKGCPVEIFVTLRAPIVW